MITDHSVLFQPSDDLSGIPDGSIDLIVTSPPYPMIAMWDTQFIQQDENIAAALAGNDGRAAWELMHRQLDRVWHASARVIRDGGFICINIGDATRTVGTTFRLFTNHARIITAGEDLGLHSLPSILWRKPANGPNKFMGSGMLPAGAYITLEHEYILVFRKGEKRVFSKEEQFRRRESAFFWEERNAWFSDLWELRGKRQGMSDSSARLRSAAFPFEIAFRLINMYSQMGDTVLDPFAGTGTTTIAAMASARNSISVEIETAMAPVFADHVRAAGSTINQRQIARLHQHNQFVAQTEAERGSVLPYHNKVLRCPVMTRQEQTLALPTVTEISHPVPGHYQVTHETLHPGTPPGVEHPPHLGFTRRTL